MKAKKLSILCAVAILGVSAVSLASCGGGVDNAGEAFKLLTIDDLKAKGTESNPIVVDFWHSFGHNISKELEPLVENFETEMANQGLYIDVKMTAVGGGYDGLRERVNLGTRTNDVPTMLLGYPDHFSDYIDNGILLPLDEFVNSTDEEIGIDKSDFVTSYWNEVEMKDLDGTEIIAGIPFNKSTEIMYYNASAVDPILKELGYGEEVDGSWVWTNPTWDELATVSQKLREKVEAAGGYTWTYNNKPNTATKTTYPVYIDSGSNFFITTAKQWCTSAEEAADVYTTADGKVVFKNETALAAQQYFTEKANQGIWNIPNKVNQSYGSALMNNLEAFISIGSTAGVNNNASPKYELKCTTVPQKSYDENSFRAVIQQGTNAAILSSNSNNYTRLAAWLLIKYLTNTENTTEFSMSTGYLPVRTSALESKTFTDFLADYNSPFGGVTAKAIVATNNERDYFYTDPAFSGSSLVRDRVDTMMISIYCNNKDITEAMSTAYKQLEDYDIECVDRLA